MINLWKIKLINNKWLLYSIIAGGFGIENMVKKLKNQEYMGFENLCQIS